jgi:hypothetical protein
MTEENGTTPEQPVQQGSVMIQMTPQGMAIQITPQPFTLIIDNAGMESMVTQHLAAHPELMDKLVKAQVAQKQIELTIIKDIKASKLN